MEVDVIVIGTGFGASVAVTKLLDKTPNATIHMLERGLWWFTPERPLPPYFDQFKNDPKKQPIQYWPRPDHSRGMIDLLSVVQTNNPVLEGFRHFFSDIGTFFTGKKRPQPLYRYNLFKDIDIVTASGVGGGSLIYANVSIKPKEEAGNYPVMANWPLKLTRDDYEGTPQRQGAIGWMTQRRGKTNQIVTKFPLPTQLGLNLGALDANHEPLYLGKSRALRDVANVTGADWKPTGGWEPLNLALFDYDTTGMSGADLNKNPPCERQGRCIQGCLPGARHTLNKTLINQVLSTHPNVSLESLADVSHISLRPDGKYEVFYKDTRDGNKKSHIARFVIVSAGTLGSTAILLRSHEKGTLKLSNQRGKRFSTNGDFAGFVVDAQTKLPANKPRYNIFPTRGPINTSHVQFVTNDGKVQVNVEDGGIPPMLAAAVGAGLRVLEDKISHDKFMQQLNGAFMSQKLPDFQDWFPIEPDPSNPKRFQTEDEMLSSVFYFNCMGTDDATGVFSLKADGEIDLKFTDQPATQKVYKVTEDILKAMADAMGGRYVPWFTWDGFQKHKLVTVHPLGGNSMGNSPTEGVVNTKGQVFRVDQAAPNKQVYDGLYVMDASVFPGPVAVNPTLTIVALALRIVEGIQL